jgi:uncharacterized membrane protein YdjX (TVP38/TMEM64 family)
MGGKRARWLLVAVLFLALVGGAMVCWKHETCRVWVRALGDRDLLTNLLDQMGPWAPLVLVLAQMLQVILAPIPGQVVGIVAGYLYGVLLGTLLCEVGLALGSLVAISLARRLGRPLVERVAGPELMKRIDGYIEKRGVLALLLIFLLPFLPDDSVCLIAGLTRIRLAELLLVATVGRLPGLLVSTLIGAQAHDLTVVQLLAIAIVSILLASVFFLYQHHLEQFMFQVLDRFRRD